ncbi:MAG: hypothetical protein Q9162_002681 [Coniocarpon cinnabarinum]
MARQEKLGDSRRAHFPLKPLAEDFFDLSSNEKEIGHNNPNCQETESASMSQSDATGRDAPGQVQTPESSRSLESGRSVDYEDCDEGSEGVLNSQETLKHLLDRMDALERRHEREMAGVQASIADLKPLLYREEREPTTRSRLAAQNQLLTQMRTEQKAAESAPMSRRAYQHLARSAGPIVPPGSNNIPGLRVEDVDDPNGKVLEFSETSRITDEQLRHMMNVFQGLRYDHEDILARFKGLQKQLSQHITWRENIVDPRLDNLDYMQLHGYQPRRRGVVPRLDHMYGGRGSFTAAELEYEYARRIEERRSKYEKRQEAWGKDPETDEHQP